jgi:hypothetical protein
MRLTALHNDKLLDTQTDDAFALLTELAAELCCAPFASLSLVDEGHVSCKSLYGSLNLQSPRGRDYCSWCIPEPEKLSIPDLTADARTAILAATTIEPAVPHVQRGKPDQRRRLSRGRSARARYPAPAIDRESKQALYTAKQPGRNCIA